ncbi:hypothetical protein BNJ_00008 [Kaumoebavirus]|uniref:hypothetical protein n=1 Tax=Kaumoebavirus TaxID=1859492 RepID=UPI0009C2451B|nr:hypothetical protein BNJ_00008 [Kaumoebavirus]ARA71855.1 hypothetical protein BNJ_00008 [Kaumoebavirus]
MFKCLKCGTTFTTKGRLQLHEEKKVCDKKICNVCKKAFKSERDLLRHNESKIHKRLMGIEKEPTELEKEMQRLEKLTKEMQEAMQKVEKLKESAGKEEPKQLNTGVVYNNCTFNVTNSNEINLTLVVQYHEAPKKCNILRLGDWQEYYKNYSDGYIKKIERNLPVDKILGTIHGDVVNETELRTYLSNNREFVICDHGGGKFPKQDYLEELRKFLVLQFVDMHNRVTSRPKINEKVLSILYSLLTLQERETCGIDKEKLLKEYWKEWEQLEVILLNSMEHLTDDSLIPNYDDRTKPNQYRFGLPKVESL